MAKKKNQSDIIEPVIDTVSKEPVKSELIEIEIIKAVAGMEVGTIKKVPSLLARQIIELGNAKLKN